MNIDQLNESSNFIYFGEKFFNGDLKKSFTPVGWTLSKALASSLSLQMASTCFQR